MANRHTASVGVTHQNTFKCSAAKSMKVWVFEEVKLKVEHEGFGCMCGNAAPIPMGHHRSIHSAVGMSYASFLRFSKRAVVR
mmetsp:Transcript_6079/g.7450  ORF Transcript_6079/g.7450 Transcript_6079/m.7450 type:complete len:82 (-) Transcript_6079:1092-1337(-)